MLFAQIPYRMKFLLAKIQKSLEINNIEMQSSSSYFGKPLKGQEVESHFNKHDPQVNHHKPRLLSFSPCFSFNQSTSLSESPQNVTFKNIIHKIFSKPLIVSKSYIAMTWKLHVAWLAQRKMHKIRNISYRKFVGQKCGCS